MGIFGAMTTAVTGLNAQAYALENISGNIANSQTTGFKKVETSFVDLIPDAVPTRQLAGAVTAYSRTTNNSQGTIQNSTASTHLGINGDGYFVVQQRVGSSDGRPVFSGTDLYTRRGDFQLDKDGYLVNGAGYYLKAMRVDRDTGNVATGVPEVIRLNSNFMPANPTTRIDYVGNVASFPQPLNHSQGGSHLLDPTLVTAGGVTGANSDNFVKSSIDGGTISAYDAQGSKIDMQLRWGKTADRAAGPPAVNDTWQLFYLTDTSVPSTGAGSTGQRWRSVGTYEFGADANLVSINGATAQTGVTITGLTVDGKAVGDVRLEHGATGLTQAADGNGRAEISADQNGYAAGRLSNIAVDGDGRIQAVYTNGRNVGIASIPLANFTGDSWLKKMDGGAFGATSESGPALLNGSGRIQGQALENSTVDVAEEFTKLIVTQQAYAANTRIVTTSNQMLQETINMIR